MFIADEPELESRFRGVPSVPHLRLIFVGATPAYITSLNGATHGTPPERDVGRDLIAINIALLRREEVTLCQRLRCYLKLKGLSQLQRYKEQSTKF